MTSLSGSLGVGELPVTACWLSIESRMESGAHTSGTAGGTDLGAPRWKSPQLRMHMCLASAPLGYARDGNAGRQCQSRALLAMASSASLFAGYVLILG